MAEAQLRTAATVYVDEGEIRDNMQSEPRPPKTSLARWRKKFADALRGVGAALSTENSFWVHIPVAAVVAAVGVWVQLSAERWAAIVICITIVWAAEMFNSSIERLAREVTEEQSPRIRDALDMASGAVLVTVLGAAMVGLMILGPPLWKLLSAAQ